MAKPRTPPKLVGRPWEEVTRELYDYLVSMRNRISSLNVEGSGGSGNLILAAGTGISRTVATSGGVTTDTVSVKNPPTARGEIWSYSTEQDNLPAGTTNGNVLTVDDTSSFGISWKPAGVNWQYARLSFADFSIADVTKSVNIFTLPAANVLHGIVIKTNLEFTGGAITGYTFDLGIAGNTVKYASGYDAFTPAASTNFQTAMLLSPEDFAVSTNIQITANCVDDTLNNATQGTVDVWFFTSELTYPISAGTPWSANTWLDPIGIPYEQAPG